MENSGKKETEQVALKEKILYAAPVEACRLMGSDMRGLSQAEAVRKE